MKTQQRNRSSQRRRPQQKQGSTLNIWHVPSPLPELDKIVSPAEPSALVRSLGDPPMHRGTADGHYFASVVERASAVARALAFSADLLATPDDH